ncbi:MAG: hypothetical protein LBQ80_01985 [Clostridium sp.]|nr:hypothetical protein [Clostridium sp.]
MEETGFVFRKVYYDAAAKYPRQTRLEIYERIIEYGLFGKLPENPSSSTLLIKAMIDEDNAAAAAKARRAAAKARKDAASKAFIPPTIDEVRAYCQERGNSIDPEGFIAYYAARGWKLNNGQPMLSWQSCVITWESKRWRKRVPQDISDRPPPSYDLEVAERLAARTDRAVRKNRKKKAPLT